LYESDATKFTVVGNGVRPPLSALTGFGTVNAVNLVKEREKGPFASKEELMLRAKLGKAAMEILENTQKPLIDAYKNEIEPLATACFTRLKAENYFIGKPFDEYIASLVDFYCVTNILHPFREGNGRTQRIFLSQLIRHAGYEIDFANINTDELMFATIQAANGVDSYLKEIFAKAIQEK
jgi:hypothetical protein